MTCEKKRPSSSRSRLPVQARGLVSHLIPPDFFGLGSDFPRESKGCDSVHALECLSDVNQRPASSTTQTN